VQTLIRRQALVRGAAAFLVDARSARIVSYADLDTAARQWARWLHERAVPLGASVLVDIDDPIDFAVAHLGLIGSGRCSVPIDPAAPTGDVLRTIAATEPVLVVSDRARRPDLAGVAFQTITAGRPPTTGELVVHDAASGAVRLSTSGSTGA